MKVSIIIPFFNVQAYIERCIDSVLAQENDAFEIECILVNDNSNDASLSLIHLKLDNYLGNIVFKIICHENNKGVSAARNTGIMAASGSYIMFVDSDDQLVSGSIGIMIEALRDYPELDFVEGNFLQRKDDKIYPNFPKQMFFNSKKQIMEYFYMNKLAHCPWNKLLKRKLVIDQSLFFEEGMLFEDIPWSNKLFQVVSSFLIIPKTTYVYEDNPSSIMNTVQKSGTKSIDSFAWIINDLLNCPMKEVYVEHKLFIFRTFLNALDINNNSLVDVNATHKLLSARNRLFFMSLRDWRFFLMLFFMLGYEPFYSLLNYSFFRRHFYKMEIVICFIENKMNIFHRHSLNSC